jgi:tetratricopeptide (TPR) repeat protein
MSLIINMLKDLDKREKRNPSLPDISLNYAEEEGRFFSYIKTFFSGKAPMVLGLIAIASIMLVTVSLKYKLSHTSTLLKPLTSNPVPVNTEKNVELPSLAPAQIAGITIQSGESSTEMHFNINAPFLYHITTIQKDHFLITFENTSLQTTLPPVDLSNALVKAIITNKSGNDTQFDIVLHPGWQLGLLDAADAHNNHNRDFKIKFTSTSPLPVDKNPATPATTATVQQAVPASNSVKTPVTEDQLNARYQTALSTAEAGDKETAINLLTGILNESRLYHQARTSLIALLMDIGDFTTAEQSIKAGLTLSPTHIPYIELKARILMMKNDITGAIDLLQQSSPDINDYPDFYAFLAALYERSNKDSLAASVYHQLLQVDPKNGRWWFGLALSLDKSGHPKDASFAYSKAVSRGSLNTASLSYAHKRLQALHEANSNESA